jgi:proteasome lid subunit RPN8/RPN11
VNPEVIDMTLDVLRQFGAHGYEGLVLWTGRILGSEAYVSQIYVPDQHPVKSESGVGYFVDAETLFKLNRELSNSGHRLIAQVHSHPSEAYHSEADDRYAIVTANGGLSFVVPDFGQAPSNPLCWAVYRLKGGTWQELPRSEVRSLIRIGDC